MPPTKGQSNDRKQSFSEWKLDSREEQKHSGHMVLSLLRVCGEQACLSQNQNRDGREFPRRPDAEKLSPYECGFEAFEDSRMRFDVRYYLVAIIFIVFDLEIAFFFPWAVSLKVTGTFGLLSMLIFALILVVALAYDYKKGALEWD